MQNPLLSPCCFALALAACGGGATSTDATPRAGGVHVVLDTATGSEAFVQFEVAAAVFATADGATTTNVLSAPTMVTFADPTGQASGLSFPNVPSGDYATLHLMLVPGSGHALLPAGQMVPVASAVDLQVPIADGLQHTSLATSWLAIGHNRVPLALASGTATWTPSMTGRADGSAHELDGLSVAIVDGRSVSTTFPTSSSSSSSSSGADGVLRLEFSGACTFEDHADGGLRGRADFLASTRRGDELCVQGELHRDGRFVARHVRRGRGNDGPRLLGRITELRPANQSFVLDVLAEVRRGGRRFLLPREPVLVLAEDACIHRPNRRDELAFVDLQVGLLAKVKWSSRTPVPGGLTEVVAREIEVTGAAEPMRPEWQGRVVDVDLDTRTIVVEPRHDDPIVIGGVAVAPAHVVVDGETTLQRKERHGGAKFTIGLGDIVAGQDRIWWRGEVTGPATVAATWVRVREE